MTDTGFYSSPARQLYLLEHHFNYIHKGWIRQVLFTQRFKWFFMQRSESLKKNQDFQKVYRNGTSKGNRYLVMYVLKNQYMKNRLGISVSKKVGNSVVRHRLTRLIRESYRLNEAEFENSLDIVVVARPQAKDRTYQEIESALMHLAGKHCIAGKNNDKEVSDQNN